MATTWGFISTDKIISDFVNALKCSPTDEHTLVAVAARDLSRAQEFANEHGIQKAYGDYLSLAQDPDVDCKTEGPVLYGISMESILPSLSILLTDTSWSPTKVIVNDKEKEFPLPETPYTFNYTNSAGLMYEASEVRRCLKAGWKESPLLPLSTSLQFAQLEDEIRKQIGVIYAGDL